MTSIEGEVHVKLTSSSFILIFHSHLLCVCLFKPNHAVNIFKTPRLSSPLNHIRFMAVPRVAGLTTRVTPTSLRRQRRYTFMNKYRNNIAKCEMKGFLAIIISTIKEILTRRFLLQNHTDLRHLTPPYTPPPPKCNDRNSHLPVIIPLEI